MNQIEQYNELLNFIDDFGRQYEAEKIRLPYHINLIDELHINENGHSRILFRLLSFVNEKGEYEILQSLLDYIICHHFREDCDFSKITIKSPIITQEEERIDLWVRDSGYALIFENKIYNAADQDAQLFRYIEKTNKQSYKNQNIYIIYLSSDGKEPDQQSWGECQNEFINRYVNLSFKNDILPWLKESVLPSVRFKDCFLQSAIQQYIDYLEGLFLLRNIQKSMNMNLEKTIMNHLDLESNNNELECLDALTNLTNAIETIQKTTDSIARDYISKILKKTKEELLKNNIVNDVSEKNKNCYVALSLPYENKMITVVVAQDSVQLYCQVQYDYNSVAEEEWKDFQNTSLGKYLYSNLLKEHNHTGVWTYFGHPSEYKNHIEVIKCFKNTVEKCVDFILKEKNSL